MGKNMRAALVLALLAIGVIGCGDDTPEGAPAEALSLEVYYEKDTYLQGEPAALIVRVVNIGTSNVQLPISWDGTRRFFCRRDSPNGHHEWEAFNTPVGPGNNVIRVLAPGEEYIRFVRILGLWEPGDYVYMGILESKGEGGCWRGRVESPPVEIRVAMPEQDVDRKAHEILWTRGQEVLSSIVSFHENARKGASDSLSPVDRVIAECAGSIYAAHCNYYLAYRTFGLARNAQKGASEIEVAERKLKEIVRMYGPAYEFSDEALYCLSVLYRANERDNEATAMLETLLEECPRSNLRTVAKDNLRTIGISVRGSVNIWIFLGAPLILGAIVIAVWAKRWRWNRGCIRH